ncbi:DUF3363 domain-containing protein [Bradyrhizobium sp. AZCC 1588]|uniref:DUF3363 domain-containing protein n=1 Tax=unclassified Bradyrhizobium TaxID=2631580 RepID=UPI003FA6107F
MSARATVEAPITTATAKIPGNSIPRGELNARITFPHAINFIKILIRLIPLRQFAKRQFQYPPRCDLTNEIEHGRWILADRTEATLRQLGERNEVIKAVHGAFADQGLSEARGSKQPAKRASRRM